jgi:hypothetical protein
MEEPDIEFRKSSFTRNMMKAILGKTISLLFRYELTCIQLRQHDAKTELIFDPRTAGFTQKFIVNHKETVWKDVD